MDDVTLGEQIVRAKVPSLTVAPGQTPQVVRAAAAAPGRVLRVYAPEIRAEERAPLPGEDATTLVVLARGGQGEQGLPGPDLDEDIPDLAILFENGLH